jgi:hypothetical protein
MNRMRTTAILLAAQLMLIPQASAQPAGQDVADAATFGAVAALAPLCDLHDESWAADLRRAARQRASGTDETEDTALTTQPGAGQLSAALGYGEMEALEDLAVQTPEVTCKSLQTNPALARAEEAVRAFRRLRDGKPVG